MKPEITLERILTLARPYGSQEEALLRTLLMNAHGGTVDTAGNLWVIRPRQCGSHSDTLWVAHLDTVHTRGRVVEISKLKDSSVYFSESECLGADDGAGVWLLHQLILAGKPGTYLFTVGEERGCIGASAVPDDRLKEFTRCIEIDREGTRDIVYHQCVGDTASLKFAQHVARALHMGHVPSNRGIYTDNAQFAHVIPECVNLAAGYYAAHSKNESLDNRYLKRLLKRLLAVSWDDLPTYRLPVPASGYSMWTGWGHTASTPVDPTRIMWDVLDIIEANPYKTLDLLLRTYDIEEIHKYLTRGEDPSALSTVPPWDEEAAPSGT